jgi:hypothetical protein
VRRLAVNVPDYEGTICHRPMMADAPFE